MIQLIEIRIREIDGKTYLAGRAIHNRFAGKHLDPIFKYTSLLRKIKEN